MTEYGVEAVERALQLLNVFDEDQAAFELRELASRTGFTKPMIIRLVASLERFGHVERGADGRYRLGPSLWRLGSRYRNHLTLADILQPILCDVVQRCEETAAFYARSGDSRICLYRENSPKAVRHHVEIGDRLPLDAGAAGHLILAYSGEGDQEAQEIRRRGFVIMHGDRDPDISGIAAPIFRDAREFVGALIISGLRSRVEPIADRLLPLALDAACRASKQMGFTTASGGDGS